MNMKRNEIILSEERVFGMKIRHKLNSGQGGLDKQVTDRLFAARQAALSRMPLEASGELVTSGLGLALRGWWDEARRPVAVALLLATLAVAIDFGQALQRAAELEEVDAALLTDDLPISAYLDRGFDTWLTGANPP